MIDDRDLGYLVLLAGHPAVGPRRLRSFATDGHPEAGWRAFGGLPRADPLAIVAAHREAGVEILVPDDARYPACLQEDPEPPALLFAAGDLAALGSTRVAIVGTRRCTGAGAGFARQLGRELSGEGVTIVSGLALGIDGASHRGVLDAEGRPVGVVGSGLDVIYPVRHRNLWAEVRTRGLLLSEAPLGARPAAWRFPARNRIIAGLAHLVVVVESHAAGGSLHTVKEAADRSIQVMAVPGSVRVASCAGTNQLLADGCAPVRDTTDVLVALGLSATTRAVATDRRTPPDATGTTVLEAFDWEAATLEHLAVRTGLALPELAMTLQSLLDAGWIHTDGGWYERVGA